jgi:hypothetical protein
MRSWLEAGGVGDVLGCGKLLLKRRWAGVEAVVEAEELQMSETVQQGGCSVTF